MRGFIFVACASVLAVTALEGQERPQAERERDVHSFFYQSPGSANRAVIGITSTTSGSLGDSLGVMVRSVVPGGPAERAGITEGSRIAAINDVNLRISADDARAGDMAAVTNRRLTRELSGVNPGDEVRLRVHADGRMRDVRVRTVAASELPRTEVAGMRIERDSLRPMLGISIGGTGSARDTLGLFVMSVRPDGPAERAGILEGHRIAEINGVSVRVAREDAEDPVVRSAMSSRFTRELRKVRPGDAVQLRVWSDGRYRDVRVNAVSAQELGVRSFEIFPGAGVQIFRGEPGEGGATIVLPNGRELERHMRELPERIRMLIPQRII